MEKREFTYLFFIILFIKNVNQSEQKYFFVANKVRVHLNFFSEKCKTVFQSPISKIYTLNVAALDPLLCVCVCVCVCVCACVFCEANVFRVESVCDCACVL